MQLNNKFLFERDFDVEKVKKQQADITPAVTEIVPPVPMFDLETVELARQQAYEQGIQDGMQQAEQGQVQMLAGLWDRAGFKLAALLEADAVRNRDASLLALRSAFHAIKKFWPRLQAPTMQADLEQFISDQLAQNTDEGRIVLRVNDAQLDAIAHQVPRLKELQGFPGKVITMADDSVMMGDCKMEWADGGVEKLGRQMMAQLDQLMERLIGQLAQSKNETTSHELSQDKQETNR